MTLKERENELKLDILESLARSQRALARIIEGMADVTGNVPGSSDALRENISTISRYQLVLAEKITGIRIASYKKGKPGNVWLNPKVKGSKRRLWKSVKPSFVKKGN